MQNRFHGLVVELLQATNAQFNSAANWRIRGICPDLAIMEFTALGFYAHHDDIIALTEQGIASPLRNEVVLHELIHWTGNVERLNRYTLYADKGTQAQHTEEAIAQLGMFLLGRTFGFDMATLYTFTDSYLLMYPLADIPYALAEARRAHDYLIEILLQRRQKAA